jgi:hypothetical protein
MRHGETRERLLMMKTITRNAITIWQEMTVRSLSLLCSSTRIEVALLEISVADSRFAFV